MQLWRLSLSVVFLSLGLPAIAFPNMVYRGFYFDPDFQSYTGQLCLDLGEQPTSVTVRWGEWQTAFASEQRYLELTAFGNNPLEIHVWLSSGESRDLKLRSAACGGADVLRL